MNSLDIHPSESVPPIMVNVNSDQTVSVAAPISCFSSFMTLGINFCGAYLRVFLLGGAWEEKEKA